MLCPKNQPTKGEYLSTSTPETRGKVIKPLVVKTPNEAKTHQRKSIAAGRAHRDATS